jgi:hypothetical protein
MQCPGALHIRAFGIEGRSCAKWEQEHLTLMRFFQKNNTGRQRAMVRADRRQRLQLRQSRATREHVI